MQATLNANWLAYMALFVWPLVALYLYMRLPVGQATLWAILAGYLLLPVGTELKIPMVPPINKVTIPNIAALVGCLLFARRKLKFFYGVGVAEILLFALVIGPFITSLLNSDPVIAGGRVLPGVGPYDAGSAVIFQTIFMLPFFLGRQFLRRPEDNAEIMRVLVVAGLAYSLLMLFEVRMSPQLHTWIYGYFPNSFLQQFREGGFRPVVFLGHGLLVAFFAMTTVVAAAALWRSRTRVARMPASAITAYLSVVLVLCKTLSALIYGAFLVPLVRWASPRLQVRVASILVLIAVSYPVLRAADLVPTSYILQMASSVSEDREGSLRVRFEQERQLLDKAWQRMWFGWGRYGRNRVYNDEGGDESITDGGWIIVFGTFGLVGFFAMFGLLALSVLRAVAALQYAQTQRDRTLLAALALIVAISMIDLLPNSSISSWTWLLAGSLLGRADALYASVRQRAPLDRVKPSRMTIQSHTARHG